MLCVPSASFLTHWGRMMHVCDSKLSSLGSDNGLSPGRRQAIIWTNAGILLIGPPGTNFSEIVIGIQIFSIKEMQLKMSSVKWRPFCLGLNELILCGPVTPYGGIELGQHWFRYQAITWFNIDISSIRFCYIHLGGQFHSKCPVAPFTNMV